jgi:nitrate reductase gamma subunit
MEDNQNIPSTPPSTTVTTTESDEQKGRTTLIVAIAIVVVVLAGIILSLVYLFNASLEQTSRIRDIFIIFMALEFLVVGIALVILMVQLATLINLLQNEIKPILNSTNETVSTLRGTVTFLSDNLAEPVIKMNEYLAGLKRALDLLRINRH